MNTLIISNDPGVSLKLRASLAALGVECGKLLPASLEALQSLHVTGKHGHHTLAFFGSKQLTGGDLELLRRIVFTAGERLQIVVASKRCDYDTVLQAVRCGAIDYVDVDGDLDAQLRHVIERIQTSQHEEMMYGRLITVTSATGGACASLVAVNLAAVIAQRTAACCLIDANYVDGDVGVLLKTSPQHTIASVAGRVDQLDRFMFAQLLAKHDSGVHVLNGGEPFTDHGQCSTHVVQKIVALALADYSYVVMEVAARDTNSLASVLALSQRIIVPITLDMSSLYRTKRLLEVWKGLQIHRERVLLVASHSGRPKELPLTSVSEALELPVAFALPDDPEVVNASINVGVPFVIGAPKAQVSSGIMRLADTLMGIVPRQTSFKEKVQKLIPARLAASLSSYMTAPSPTPTQ